MKRSGIFAYLFCGIGFGSFFYATTFYLYLTSGQARSGRDFFFVWFFAALLTLLPVVVSSVLARGLAFQFRWRSFVEWIVLGTLCQAAVLALFGLGGRWLESWPHIGWGKTALYAFCVGPWFALQHPWWLLVLPALATSTVLWRVHVKFTGAKDKGVA